jgi:hypothetical protein
MNELLMVEAIFSFCLLMYGGFCFYFFSKGNAYRIGYLSSGLWLPHFCSEGDILPYWL